MNDDAHAALRRWGWTHELEESLPDAEGLIPGRIVLEQRGVRRVVTADGPVDARVAGSLRHRAEQTIADADASPTGDAEALAELPAVGDWVLLRPAQAEHEIAQIQGVLPRSSKISRKAAGLRTREQVVAANVDQLFVVMGLDGDFNPRRLERYLITARAGGSRPLVVLNKRDLSDDLEQQLAQLEAICEDVPVVVTSCETGHGLDELRSHLRSGETVALVGSSGVGKSSLLNALSGEELMRTGEVRSSDDRGRHTTTHRQMWRLPGGALVIDTPGIRELQPWIADEELEDSFDDVAALARECRFRNCGHDQEPGCRVQQAIADEELEPERLAAFRALAREAEELEERQLALRKAEERKKVRAIHRANRKHKPRRLE